MVAAPLALLVPVSALLAHYVFSVASVGASLGWSVLPPLFCVVYVLTRQQAEWSSESYAPRRGLDVAAAVDWSEPRWQPVARALAACGYNPAAVQAVGVFSQDANIQVIHRSRFSEGRFREHSLLHGYMHASGRFKSIARLGAAGAIIFTQVAPRLSSGVAFWDVQIVFWAVGLPLWSLAAAAQVRVNMLRPDNVVEIPVGWRLALSGNPPAAQVAFAHEMAHARHGDTVVRRLLSHVVPLATVLGWAEAVIVASMSSPHVLVFILILAGPSAMVSIRRARRLLYTIQELRADADACPDEPTMGHMRAILEQAQQAAPSRIQAARLRALNHCWADPVAGRFRSTVIAMALGCIVPITLVPALLLTGAIPAPVSPPG